MSTSITDKLINHVITKKVLIPLLDKSLIENNIATRKNKGTHLGIKLLKKYLNEMDGIIYALKFDIKKYFYNIDHEILINLLKNKIKNKNIIIFLTKIINSTNYDYINKKIKEIKQKEINKLNNIKMINEVKNIPYYKKGKGLPIGNMSSQVFAIYYLNELDHYIKERLHIKYYIRYMDDGIILSNNKNYLRYTLKEIKKLIEKYKLELNSKTKIINVSIEGIEFLGFRFYKQNNVYLKLRNSTKKRFKNNKKINKIEAINNYHSHLKWGDCFILEKR